MSLETLIGGLTRDEQIVAMELLWKRLTTENPSAAPPEWHRSVAAERVARKKHRCIRLVFWRVEPAPRSSKKFFSFVLQSLTVAARV